MTNMIQVKKDLHGKLNLEFKKVIKESKKELLEIQENISVWEKNNPDFTNIKDQFYERITKNVERLLKEPNIITQNFSPEEHQTHALYYIQQIGPLFLQTPFHNRALLKPLGYPGDYVMMEMLYTENYFQGATNFIKLLNAACCKTIAGKAVRARIPYLVNKIANASKQNPVTILSLGSGSAREVSEFLKIAPASIRGSFYLVDLDDQSLSFAQKLLTEPLSFKKNLHFYFHKVDLMEAFNHEFFKKNKFDLIYSAGLFDYIPDDFFQMAIGLLFDSLTEGGELIIGNMSPAMWAKVGIFYLDDWPLIYRESEDLLSLVPQNIKRENVKVEKDTSGANLFLNIKKNY